MASAPHLFRYAAEYAAFRILAGLIRALPVETASSLSGRLWRLAAPIFRRHGRALAHLALAFPEKSEGERELIARAMWENLGRTFAEAFHIDHILASDRISYADPEALAALGATPGGKVLCSLHSGNWEIVAAGGAKAGLDVAGVYQRIKNPRVDAYVTRLRARLYPGGLHAKAPETATALMRHVKRGGAVAILADLRDRNGVSAMFFGRPAPSTPFPALLARSLNAPVVVARCVRLPGVRFRIEFENVDVPQGPDRKTDIAAITQDIQSVFERWVCEDPSQWMWAHRRWG
jgi:KDO2-lipid IV(A) lauroyltransferase